MKNNIVFIFLFVIMVTSCITAKVNSYNKSPNWANKIETKRLNNLYKVNENLFRSEQPDSKGMKYLESIGIKTIINLRDKKTDNHEAKHTKLELIHIPINTWTISYEDIVNSMKAINSSNKPVLIHCLHGSDRTGCIAAVYRITNCGWTKEEAIKEFLEGGFGYHEKWFPNILELLNSLDIEKLKKDIEN